MRWQWETGTAAKPQIREITVLILNVYGRIHVLVKCLTTSQTQHAQNWTAGSFHFPIPVPPSLSCSVAQAKNLGIMIDSSLSFSPYIQWINKLCQHYLQNISRKPPLLPPPPLVHPGPSNYHLLSTLWLIPFQLIFLIPFLTSYGLFPQK